MGVGNVKIRSRAAALREAVERWGKSAAVLGPRVDHYKDGTPRPRYVVGRVVGGLYFEIEGTGDSWDEAFAKVRSS